MLPWSFSTAVAGLLLLVSQTATLPIGEDQQPLFLSSEGFPTPFWEHDHSIFSPIRDVLVANKVIGDVLDDFEPSYYIDIKYPKSHETVLLGNDIPVDAVSDRPVFTFQPIVQPAYAPRRKPQNPFDSDVRTDAEKSSTYTLVLTDPDAKSRSNPKWSEMCHWILTNLTSPTVPPTVPPHDPPQILNAEPGELEKYLPPSPPPKTGAHRYVFVLLRGDSSNLEAPAERRHWGYDGPRHGVRDWAAENGLTVVGANFFFAQNEKQ